MIRPRPHRVALTLVLSFSALLECYRLGQNSWANTYYSAAVKLDARIAAQLLLRLLGSRAG